MPIVEGANEVERAARRGNILSVHRHVVSGHRKEIRCAGITLVHKPPIVQVLINISKIKENASAIVQHLLGCWRWEME
jgi:hypothetical protein